MDRIWETFLTEQDKAVFDASGYGSSVGFGKRPALLIVDVSYAFTGDKPEPILLSIKRWRNSCGLESWAAISVIKKLADTFRSKRLPVIYTSEYYRPDKWDVGGWAWKNTRTAEKPHPTLDANQIVAEITPQSQDIVVLKQKPSAFFGTNLLGHLVLLGCDSIVITGTSTSGCVRATVIDAFSNNFRVSVVEDACFDRAQASHAINLCDMQAKYADVLPSTAVLDYVRTLPDDLFPNLPYGNPGPRTAMVDR